jgi:hypothetical protein
VIHHNLEDNVLKDQYGRQRYLIIEWYILWNINPKPNLSDIQLM